MTTTTSTVPSTLPIKPFHLDFPDEDLAALQARTAEIIHSGNLILGDYTEKFETAFASYIGTRFAVSVNSGATALEILCRLRKVEGRRVLVPTNTNFATVAAVLRVGGLVTYLDMDPSTFAPSLSMVESALARRNDVAGILWVHIGGVISPEFPDVVRLCRDRNIFIFEDAAHAHGSSLGGVKAGALADGGAFSFFATKVMTTGEGGMITTNSADEAYLAQSLRNQGKRGMKFGGLHHDFGNSTRITEIQAAFGLLQLARLPEMLERRRKNYIAISTELSAAGIRYCSTAHMDAASQYKLIVLLPESRTLEGVKDELKKRGVIAGGGVYEIPCHRQPVFESIPVEDQYPNAESLCPRHLCPPLTSGMTEAEASYVGRTVADVLVGAR